MDCLAYVAGRTQNMSTTVVIGAGWSGLSCAYTLAKAGQRVIVIEAAPQSGGRARSIKFKDIAVDNGQHIFLGAYQHTLQLLRDLGLDPNQLLQRLPMQIYTQGSSSMSFKLPKIAAPYNLLWGLLTARNLSWADKYRALRFCWQLQAIKFQLAHDCTVIQLLNDHKQSQNLIKALWEPIALAAMTTPIDQGSAQVFLNTLRLSFTQSQHASNWLLPRVDLSRVLPLHIEQFLHTRNCQIVYTSAVKNLRITDNVCELVCSRDQTWQADHVVIATPPWQAKTLIPLPALEAFSYQPITTIYIETLEPVALPYYLIGLTGNTCQWIFDRSFAGQPNILSAIISGPGAHQTMDNKQLLDIVLAELSAFLSNCNKVINTLVVREKRAAFTCDVKIQAQRPTARTHIKNLWLTGDYLQTGLPATIESAIMSGVQTGKELLGSISPRSNLNC